MALKQPATSNAQPAKPTTMQDESEPGAAPPPFEHGTATENDSPLPASATGGAMSTQVAGGSGKRGDFTSAEGKLGFGSFPQVKLESGELITGSDTEGVKEFDGHMIASKSRWIVKADNSQDADFFFTYDKVLTTQGELIQAKLAEWKSEGHLSPVWKEYNEVMVKVYSPDSKYAGRLVILSLPPVSVGRFSGYCAELGLETVADATAPNGTREKRPDDVLTRIYVGGKIKTRDGKTFHPWAFASKGAIEGFQAPEPVADVETADEAE